MLVLLFSTDSDLIDDVSDWCRYFGLKLVVSESLRGWQASLDPADVLILDGDSVVGERVRNAEERVTNWPRTAVVMQPEAATPDWVRPNWLLLRKPLGLKDFQKLIDVQTGSRPDSG